MYSFLSLFLPYSETTECEFSFVKGCGLKIFKDVLDVWHTMLVWKKCISGSSWWAENTANIPHNEYSIPGRTGQEHLLVAFMTDQYSDNVASKGFSPL